MNRHNTPAPATGTKVRLVAVSSSPAPELSAEEMRLVQAHRQMDGETRGDLIAAAEAWAATSRRYAKSALHLISGGAA